MRTASSQIWSTLLAAGLCAAVGCSDAANNGSVSDAGTPEAPPSANKPMSPEAQPPGTPPSNHDAAKPAEQD